MKKNTSIMVVAIIAVIVIVGYWYSTIGIFITYKIFNWREDCPAYE